MANIFEFLSKDGNITPGKVRKSRQMQFRDKTAYVWGLRYRWDPSLSRIPDPRIPHFMPPCSPAQIPFPSHHLCICTTTLYCELFCICICKSTLILWLILYLYLYSYVFVRAPLYILWILFDQRIAAKEVQCSTTHGKILNRIDFFTIINHFLSFSTSLTSEVDFLCHMWNYLYCY